LSTLLHNFVLTFVPLFIAIDALGILPLVISISEGMTAKEKRSLVNVAIITAIIVGLVFLFFGQIILSLMGITVGAFAIAGGIVLLVLAIKHMTTGRMVDVVKEEMVAVVPIGTPLVVGPATITTLLVLVLQYPVYIVLFTFALNLIITWVVFTLGAQLAHFMGQGGLKAVSKVFSLLLAAIAVTMIIRGLELTGILPGLTG